MSKKKTIFIIIVAIVLSLLAEVLFGAWVSARLSTWPSLRRFGLLNPQAPIVITNNQTIRTSDTQDAIDAVNKAKSRSSAVAVLQNNRLVVTGSALNVTADGYFISSQGAFSVKGAAYFVVLNTGESVPITALFADPGTNLILFRANLNSVSVAQFADAQSLVAGQKVILLAAGLTSFTSHFAQTWISVSQGDSSQVFNSDRPSRAFGIQNVPNLIPGTAIVTVDGEAAGLWDGTSVVSSDVIKTAIDSFFANNNEVRRPVFGFYYRNVTKAESGTLSVPQGATLVKPDLAATSAIVPNSPAAAAGLLEGDYIVQVNDTKIDEGTPLEIVLEKIKPGDAVALTVVRAKQTLILNLTAGGVK